MNSLVGYGSDDEIESDRYGRRSSVGTSGKRKEDDTNYDDVNMDMSEDSQGESEPELPPADPQPSRHSSRSDRHSSTDSRERDRNRERDFHDRRRDKDRHERDRRSPRRDDRFRDRSGRNRPNDEPRRGLLGDRPDDRPENKMPALMDLKPYGGDPPGLGRSQDARDAVSPRFADRDRRDRDREREREREKERERDRDRDSRHSRRSEERRSSGRDRNRSRSRGAAFPPPYSNSSDRRGSPPSDYRPSSYKVNRKLEVMEKMGLQIKTPDGSMATARQLRQAASEAPPGSNLPSYYNPCAVNSNKILDQVQKRKLLWSNKEKTVAEAEAAKWSGTRFSQDNDGRQVSKFMRLMGIKDPAAVKAPEPDPTADPNKKQEELFQAMQAQYEVARATTHTMRGVGLGFQRGNF